MRVLVTGGAGFIGSNLVRALAQEREFATTVIDDLCTGKRDNLNAVRKDIEFVQGTVLDCDLLKKNIAGKDIVFHLAARNVILSSQDPEMDLEVNARGTMNVLKACAAVNSPPKLVYASTSSVYGNPRYIPINEDDRVSFLNFYSVSKFAAEGYCNVFYELHDLPVVVLRYSNVYGPHQTPDNPYCGVVGKFIMCALTNEPVLIHGDGEQTRDFTFVEDAVEATITAGLAAKSVGRIYNVGTGRETSVNQLAEVILRAAQSSSAVQYIEKRDIDNIRRRVLNIEPLRRDLKYTPRYILDQGIKRTVAWFKANAPGLAHR